MTQTSYPQGKLCLRTLAAGCQPPRNGAAKTTATNGTSVMSEDRRAAARFLDLLELESRARARGLPDLADRYADRIIDAMLGGAA